MNRDFKGLWFPREIWLRKELSLLEKGVWAEIHSLYDRENGGCFASNEYLAKFFNVSDRYIREVLAKLKKLNLLEEVSFNGRKRVLRALYPNQDHGKDEDEFRADRNCSSGQTGAPLPLSEEPQFRPIYSIDKSLEKREDTSPLSQGLATLLFDALKKINPKIRSPNMQQWAKDLDLMIRVDGRTEQEIKRMIEFLLEDHGKPSANGFTWSKAIQSPAKLREHFAQMWLQRSTPVPAAAKQAMDNQKINLAKSNKEWLISTLKPLDPCIYDQILTISDHAAVLKIGGRYGNLAYTEHGFKEQIVNHLRKNHVDL